MKFEEFGNKVEKVTFTTKPQDLAKSDIYYVLSNLLGKIKEEKEEILDEFLAKVTSKLNSLIKGDTFKDQKNLLPEILKQQKNLEDKIEFVKTHLSFFITTIGISEKQFWNNEEIIFHAKNFMNSLYGQFYTQLSSLIEILPKEEAIVFYRKTVDRYNEIYNAVFQKGWYIDLEDMRAQQAKWLANNPYGRFRIYSEVKDGQLIRICKNCEKFNALKNSFLIDNEILYEVLCYMHIPLVKVWNENFELKIMKSLALGDSYCAYIYKDKGITKDNQLPKEGFLNEIFSKYK